MSRKSKSFLGIFTERGPLIALATAVGLLFGIAGPASAQFFMFGNQQPQQQRPQERPQQRGGGGGWFSGPDNFFSPFQQQQPQAQKRREDYSRAPSPEKRDTAPERNVLVLGDAMADWLAYGLEDAFQETPDMGVIRKHKTVSGLLRYQPKGDPADWAAAAKGILATEKPDAIVVMLGLQDRMTIRDQSKPEAGKGKPAVDPDLDDDPETGDTPSIITPERAARSKDGIYDFREGRWGELYAKKIEELAGILKAKGVPVLWVGLPAVRGTRSTADMQYLNSLYREGAAKADITYVDVWDGFVDEAGRFLQQGPDFEGQNRRLRSYDGVYFTKAGARKLAHYVEREISRLLAGRSGPLLIPAEPATPDANAVPGAPPPRPFAGPIVPLVASSVGSDQLLGGAGQQALAGDPLVSRTLIKGEPLVVPAGRADDSAWPRREAGQEPARGEATIAALPLKPRPQATASAAATPGPGSAPPPLSAQKQKRTRVAQEPQYQPQYQQEPRSQLRPQQSLREFFGLDDDQPQRPRNQRQQQNNGGSSFFPRMFSW